MGLGWCVGGNVSLGLFSILQWYPQRWVFPRKLNATLGLTKPSHQVQSVLSVDITPLEPRILERRLLLKESDRAQTVPALEKGVGRNREEKCYGNSFWLSETSSLSAQELLSLKRHLLKKGNQSMQHILVDRVGHESCPLSACGLS